MGFLNILKPGNDSVQKEQEETNLDQSIPSLDEKINSFKEKNQINQDGFSRSITDDSDVFTNSSTRVKISKPKSYENVKVIAEAIKDKKVVILDLEKLDNALAKRILDFVYGVCYMDDIAIEKVNEQKIFLIDPSHKINRQK